MGPRNWEELTITARFFGSFLDYASECGVYCANAWQTQLQRAGDQEETRSLQA